jgi:hypothetical protein
METTTLTQTSVVAAATIPYEKQAGNMMIDEVITIQVIKILFSCKHS